MAATDRKGLDVALEGRPLKLDDMTDEDWAKQKLADTDWENLDRRALSEIQLNLSDEVLRECLVKRRPQDCGPNWRAYT
ncbi:hypothetical protein Pint_25234 [Pistacia integerrima]|uniref:Uncharacterized protein n=1 Tax=Pistacia integerrima TaxID=434235 RepID=A0ACC0YFN8_9ROSI|nr:hypothetical protein Pint_25234 [Pistacia integerrima]